MKHLEIPYGPNTLLAGDVSLTNESFDHAFGTQRVVSYEVTDFRVFEYDKGLKDWIEKTRKFDKQHLEMFKTIFLYKAQTQLEMESA